MIAQHFPLRRRRRCARGVTLIEALLVVTLAAVLATAAAPAFTHLLARQQLGIAVDEFLLAVNLARTTARNAGARVGIEPLQAGHWASGWRVWVDRDGNGMRDDGEIVLREFAPGARTATITAHFGAGQGGTLSFDAVGNLRRPGSDGLVMGRFVFSNDVGVRAVCFSALQVRTVGAAQCQ